MGLGVGAGEGEGALPRTEHMSVLSHAAAVGVALLSLPCYGALVWWLGSHAEFGSAPAGWDTTRHTPAELGVAVFYGLILALWLGVEVGFAAQRLAPRYVSLTTTSESDLEDLEDAPQSSPPQVGGSTPAAQKARVLGVPRARLPALRAGAEFVALMGYVYLCDRTSLIPKGPKQLSKERFWGLCALILLAALASLRRTPGDGHAKPMQRDQMEEWKGWMQLMFILYHYFAEVAPPAARTPFPLPTLHPPPTSHSPRGSGGDLQRDPAVHRRVRLPHWLWQLLVLPHQARLHSRPLRADDVAAQLLQP